MTTIVRKCAAVARSSGKPCRRNAVKGTDYCTNHSQRKQAQQAEKKRRFIEALALKGATIAPACARAGVTPSLVYLWRKDDPEFAQAWDDAVDAVTDEIVAVLYERCVVGWDEPVFQRGELVGHVRKFDNKAGEFLLKARRPAEYRDRVDVSLGVQRDEGEEAEAVQVFVMPGGFKALNAAADEIVDAEIVE